MVDKTEQALEYIERNFDGSIDELIDFIRIPSVTSDRQACELAAGWVVQKLERLKLDNIRQFETLGNPVIFAEKKSRGHDAPTVLVYGHYDVQLPDPIEEWESPAFEPEIREGYLYGRGGSDMKGQLQAVLLAVQALLETDQLPVNLKFLIEGNEEAPPPVLEQFLPEHRELFQADISLNCDAGMMGKDQPTISYGLRGGSVNIIRIHGPKIDLHDGMFGGAVENPIHVLSQLIAGFHDERGRITLPGFYDKVRVLTAEERSLLAALPSNEESYLKIAGVNKLWGDQDFIPVERTGARPSINVRKFLAGALKSAIPATAEARLAVRLVPNQDPYEVHEQLCAYVADNTPPTVHSEVEYVVGYPPYLVDRSLPAIAALSEALEETWGSEPLFDLVGGGIPVVELLKQVLGMESLLTGFSLPDDHIHGPNERLHLVTLKRGVGALVRFFHRFGQRSKA